MNQRDGMLQGVTILDLSRVLAGPWATQLLADLGAEVIKIERPRSGDDTRSWGPPWLRDDQGEETNESAYFLSANRNKRSVTVDFSRPEGQSIVRRLARTADVFVENFRPGSLERYGLDHASLRAENGRLVYCSITGFGQTGVDAGRAGYDAMIQALGGLMSITGDPDGAPQKVGVAVSDLMCGMYAAVGILAAVMKARETGQGTHIDLALFDSQLAWLANQAMNYLIEGVAPGRQGGAHPNIAPYQPFKCADGHVMLAIGNDRQFASWCDVADRPELAEDPRFRTNRNRVANRRALLTVMEPVMASRACAEWLAACRCKSIPCGPINSVAEAFAEPQARERGMQITMPHPRRNALPQVANPLRFSYCPVSYRRAPPLLGEHTDEVLGEYGYSADEINRLRRAGVV